MCFFPAVAGITTEIIAVEPLLFLLLIEKFETESIKSSPSLCLVD